MEQYIPKSALLAEIERIKEMYCYDTKTNASFVAEAVINSINNAIDTLETKEVELYNNGWIDCAKQMPPETKQTSDTIQGYREWTESDSVLVWDSMYGCHVDVTKNGKWMSEQQRCCTGQVVHGIIAWRPIPEFSEELLLKTQKGENV